MTGVKSLKQMVKRSEVQLKAKSYLSIILNVNGLNSSIKTHRAAEWIKPQDTTIRLLPMRNSL